jgi:hypothetical protein
MTSPTARLETALNPRRGRRGLLVMAVWALVIVTAYQLAGIRQEVRVAADWADGYTTARATVDSCPAVRRARAHKSHKRHAGSRALRG